jgi:hypothetical protein
LGKQRRTEEPLQRRHLYQDKSEKAIWASKKEQPALLSGKGIL